MGSVTNPPCKPMKLNINDRVRVRLTEAGRKHLKTLNDKNPYKIRVKGDLYGWSEWHLWELMQIFGSEIYMGCDVPFEVVIEVI